MTDQTPHQTPDPTGQTGPRPGLFVLISLTLIAAVWAAGAVWSFEEQTAYARSTGFHVPELLPLVLDGMAIAMATVALAASLDARPATLARLGTMLAIAASAASNGAWAWTRSGGDQQTVILAAGVPVISMLAYEVLLVEVRRQVMRRRGQAARVPLPELRLVRVLLSPWSTLRTWRRVVLALTDPAGPRTPTSPVRVEATTQTPGRTPTPDRLPGPPAVESGPNRAALPDRPHQTQEQTPGPVPDQTHRAPRARRTTTGPGRHTHRTPTSPVRSVDDDAALARLRDWQTEHGRTPSLDVVQTLAGGGRSRAIRLRGLLTADEQSTDADPVAV